MMLVNNGFSPDIRKGEIKYNSNISGMQANRRIDMTLANESGVSPYLAETKY